MGGFAKVTCPVKKYISAKEKIMHCLLYTLTWQRRTLVLLWAPDRF